MRNLTILIFVFCTYYLFGQNSTSSGTIEFNIKKQSTEQQFNIKKENSSNNEGYKGVKTFPPVLIVNEINFIDSNKNNRIDANEHCFISFKIKNIGKGNTNDLTIKVKNSPYISGLEYDNLKTIDVASNDSIVVTIPIKANLDLKTDSTTFTISFIEKLGFSPDPQKIKIKTKEFNKPYIKVVDYKFFASNGSLVLGYPIQLKVLVQNVGQGNAENVKVSFSYPISNVLPNSEDEFSVGFLSAGASKELLFEFIANKLYVAKTIPITINISEKYRKFSESKEVAAKLNTKSEGNTITIKSSVNDSIVKIQMASLTSDIDKNIPENVTKFVNRYALIIGNEDYSIRQTGINSESDVAFASNDANTFKEYCVKMLGIPETNAFILINATAAEMSQKIDLITQILSKLGDSGELIFYYAGHGFPDEKTKIPYLIPVDVSASNLNSAIKLYDIYNKFVTTKAKRISIFLDACFTGGGRDAGLLAARGVKIKPKIESLSGNLVVFAATSEDQSALPYKEKQHGMFTYFLLKKIQETNGILTYGELEKSVRENVSIESLKINSKAQDPKASVSPDVMNTWETWKIK